LFVRVRFISNDFSTLFLSLWFFSLLLKALRGVVVGSKRVLAGARFLPFPPVTTSLAVLTVTFAIDGRLDFWRGWLIKLEGVRLFGSFFIGEKLDIAVFAIEFLVILSFRSSVKGSSLSLPLEEELSSFSST